MKYKLRSLLRNILCSVMMLATLSLTNCKKDDDGPDARSNSITLTNSDWKYPGGWTLRLSASALTTYNTRYADIPAPLITDDIVRNGTVLVYFNPGADDTFTSFPYTFQGISYNYNFAYEFKTGNIRLHFYYSENPNTVTLPNVNAATIKDYTIKYVILPAALGVRIKQDGINLNNFELVSKYISTNR